LRFDGVVEDLANIDVEVPTWVRHDFGQVMKLIIAKNMGL
jgi:hypothetical protein